MPLLARAARVALPVLLAATLLTVALPRMAGGHWSKVGAALGAVSPAVAVGLGVVWLIGLIAHMVVLTAALPGLTVRRGLLMSLTGSAVSNVPPLAAAGVLLYRAFTFGLEIPLGAALLLGWVARGRRPVSVSGMA